MLKIFIYLRLIDREWAQREMGLTVPFHEAYDAVSPLQHCACAAIPKNTLEAHGVIPLEDVI